MRSKEEAAELRQEVVRLYLEGMSRTEIAEELGITVEYTKKILNVHDSAVSKELLKKWKELHDWYRRYRELEQRRQQDARMSILIAWEDYSKGPGWL